MRQRDERERQRRQQFGEGRCLNGFDARGKVSAAPPLLSLSHTQHKHTHTMAARRRVSAVAPQLSHTQTHTHTLGQLEEEYQRRRHNLTMMEQRLKDEEVCPLCRATRGTSEARGIAFQMKRLRPNPDVSARGMLGRGAPRACPRRIPQKLLTMLTKPRSADRSPASRELSLELAGAGLCGTR